MNDESNIVFLSDLIESRLRKHYQNNEHEDDLPFQLENFDIDQSKKN